MVILLPLILLLVEKDGAIGKKHLQMELNKKRTQITRDGMLSTIITILLQSKEQMPYSTISLISISPLNSNNKYLKIHLSCLEKIHFSH
jgi:hypothetical protein